MTNFSGNLPSNLPETAINLLVTGTCLVYGSSAATLPQKKSAFCQKLPSSSNSSDTLVSHPGDVNGAKSEKCKENA